MAVFQTLGVPTSFKTIERVSEQVGAEVARELHGAFARVDAPAEAPPNRAELFVLQGDGMRVRELVGGSDTRTAEAADPPPAAEDELPEADRAAGWKECKVGVVVRCLPGRVKPDGEYEPPQTLVQTCVATMADVHGFGPKLRAEADRKGLARAERVAAVSDWGHGLPGMWEREFGDVEMTFITDFAHVNERLSASAKAVLGEGAGSVALHKRWEGLLYDGKSGELLKELTSRAEEQAPRPGRPSDLPEGTPGRILWAHVFYIEERRDTMRYPEYRAAGLPMGSGQVEAMCKVIGNRMKAASKRWKPVTGSEAMANLIAARASGDGRWERRWPAPVYPAPEMQPT